MQRHPGLSALSREHHGALVLARELRRTSPALPELRARFEREIVPHFAVEERELLPLSDCGDATLRAHAQSIREQHARLRQGFAALEAALEEQAQALGQLLDDHVRFEEREWFPALQDTLDDATLVTLERRLQLEPLSLITGYHTDEDGVWVAELDCGHGRHVRHAPPFQLAEWVSSETGRDAMLGKALACKPCRMPRMPPCARVYKSTPSYDASSVPKGLLQSHTLKQGTWGRIVVHEGRVAYTLEDEGNLTFVLRPGLPGTVAPSRPHHIAPQEGAVLHVEFLRCE